MKGLIEFIFFRWKWEIEARGQETWFTNFYTLGEKVTYKRNFIDYKLTNKFDGSIKVKRKYLN